MRQRPRGRATRSASTVSDEAAWYAVQRFRRARERADRERRSFDPAPPSEDDWTVPEDDTDGLRRVAPPASVGEALGAFVRRMGWEERLRGSDALSRWESIVGPELAARCEPVRVAGGTLVIRAENQVWATQLRYLAPQLGANVDRVLGAGTVHQVRIVIGPLEGTDSVESR